MKPSYATSDSHPVLIVGAGQAGATAAAALRKNGCPTPIILCGSELHAPYERPPLSKGVLTDVKAEESIFIHPASLYQDQTIDLRLGHTVISLDTEKKLAYFSDGCRIEYRSCLLSTGGDARLIHDLPKDAPRVHYVRTLQDARRLRSALDKKTHVLVIGGGFLGLEIASSARANGHQVTLVESAPRLLQRALPAVLSDWLAERAIACGIELKLGVEIESVSTRADGVQLHIKGGTMISTSVVVVAVGLVPDVELACNAGLQINRENGGISIDERCMSSAPDVYAAGDCASQMNTFFGREVRLESWQNANTQAQIAAATIAGTTLPKNVVPWFWTDQFGWNIQIYGEYEASLEYVLRGTRPSPSEPGKCIFLGSRMGVLRHAIAINAGGELRQLQPLFERQISCVTAALTNQAQPLRTLVEEALRASAKP
jgi:3-phenylpropionate/trans-cinnamate dioxygenase ferredoxin reductase subunit